MMPPPGSPADRARHWLRDAALPLWAEAGIDPANGGGVEALDHDGQPLADLPRRIRVHARQAYVFARAGDSLGRADYLDLAEGLLAFGLAQRSPEGWLPATTAADGQTADHRNMLYDIAFFVLAGAALERGKRPQPALWTWLRATLDELRDRGEAGRQGRGWFESRLGAAETPRTQNSHMHLFEAATLAAEATGDPFWTEVREECLVLFRTVFLQPDGTVLELFTHDWQPLAEAPGGQRVEPGHIAEWIYLLDRYERTTGTGTGVDIDAMFDRISGWRDTMGLLPDLAVQTAQDGSPDRSARSAGAARAARRLWPQTELLKACGVQKARGRRLAPDLEPQAVIAAIFQDYLETPVAGGWYDRRDTGGALVSTKMPASSLYHLYVAFRDLEPD